MLVTVVVTLRFSTVLTDSGPGDAQYENGVDHIMIHTHPIPSRRDLEQHLLQQQMLQEREVQNEEWKRTSWVGLIDWG